MVSLVLPIVNGFHDGLRAVLLSRWQRIAHSYPRQRLSGRFSRRISQRMAADCSFFLLLTAFTTVHAPYGSADGSRLLILPLLNGFHDGLRAVLHSGWQRIAPTSALQRLPRRIARRMAQQIAADCSFFRSSTAFTTVCAPYCSADGSGLLILPRLFRRFARRIAQWMAAHWSCFRTSKAFMTDCAPYCSADGSALLILPLVNGFHNGLHAVLLRSWQRIAHSSTRQQVSQRFARRIALRMAPRMALLLGSGFTHFFRLSMTFLTFYAPYIARHIALSFARRWLSRGFTCRIAPRIARQIAPSLAR